jgi:hypothetical protein
MAGLNDPLSQLDYGEQFLRGGPSVTQVSGIAGLASPERLNIARSTQNSLDRLDQLGSMDFGAPPPPPEEVAKRPVLAISRSTGKVWANGKLFTLDDAQGAVESQQFMGGAPAPAPLAEASDWEPLSEDAYAQHIQQIKNPSLTTLASKNFGTGFDNMQMLLGYGLQFLGAEETGQGIVRQQLEDIQRNAPYQRKLEDIPERGAVEWLVANVAQQGPNIIESIVTAAIGAGAGAVAGGGANPFTAVGGAMTSLVGKQTFKQAVLAAAKKYANGEALDAAEQKLLKEAAGITLAATKSLDDDAARAAMAGISATGRQQAITGGAVTFSAGQNYTTAVSDLYGESVEGGTPDRGLAALAAIPYAAAETLPEYLAALRFFNGFKVRALKAGGKGGRPGALAANVALGAGAGAAVEGSTEAFQETLGLGMNAEIDVNSPEGVSRLLNAFAAGAAIGGLVGGASNMNSGRATDLLSGGTKAAEQNGTTLTSGPAAPTRAQPQGELFPGANLGTPPAQVPTGPMAPPSPDMGGAQGDLFMTQPPTAGMPQGELFLRGALGRPPAQVPTGPMQPAAAPDLLAQGDLFAPPRQTMLALPPSSTIYVPPTGQQQLLSRARYAPPTERRPQGEMFTSAEMGKGQAPARVPTGPLAPPSTDMGGEQGALQPRREFPPDYGVSTPAAATQLAENLNPLRRQMELAQAQQQRSAQTPTAAEVDYNAALAEQPLVLDTEGASTGKNKLQDDGRRRIIAGFNTLTKPQQDAILVEFNNDETQLLDYVRREKPPVVRKQFAALASVEPSAFEVKTPKPAEPQAAAQPIVEETPNAPEGGKVEQGDKLKRTQNRTGVGGRRVNRNLKAKEQEAGGEAGGGNRLKQGKAAQEEVTPSPKGEGVAAPSSKKTAAETVREEATKLRTLMRNGEDLPSPETDLDDVYFAVAQVMNADDRRLPAALDGLLSWAMDSGIDKDAKDAARAYINAYVEDEDIAAAKARRKAKQEVAKEARKAEKKALKTMEAERKKGRNMLSEFDSVENAVDENGRPLKPIDKIQFKTIVDTFRRGLAKAPQIFIYKNQADLRAKNPSLYRRAAEARPQGDFDTARAAGYAFGDDQVIIFSDRIATPKMLRFVLAHEAIGHFGMRSLLPTKQFNALMDYIYENSPLARSVVDSEVEYSGMDRREAVEEYLANYASKLDTSIVTRIWNALKTALNKLGIKFEDDLTRYLVSHARRYTREGSSLFEPSKFALKMLNVESSMNGSGRFNIPSILPEQRELSFKLDMAGGMPSNITDAWGDLKSAGVNTAQAFDKFVRTVFRLANYDALRNHGAAAYETLINAVRTNVAALRNQYNEDLADIMGLNEESRNAFSYSMYIGRSIAHQRMKFDAATRSLPLVKLVNGEVVTDDDNLEKFLKLGTVSKKELNEGVTVKVPMPTTIVGTYKEDEVVIKGVRARLGRDLTDAEYDNYLKGRRKMAEIEIDLLKARYENYFATEKVSLSGIRKILSDETLTDDDLGLAKNAVNHAKALVAKNIEYDAQGLPTITTDGLTEANKFLAKFNEALIKNEKEYTDALKDEVRAFYDNKAQADAAIRAIEKFRERRRKIGPELGPDVVFAVQNRLKEIVLADQAFETAQSHARRTIAQGYIPVFREGGWQTRVEGQVNGKPVTLHPEHQNKLILRLENDRASSERGAKALNAALKDVEVEALVLQSDGTYKTQKVTLFARASKTVDDVAADPSLDIDNFLHGLRMFGLATNPKAVEKVIVTLTTPGSALRKALRFDDTPGYDMTAGITAMSRHIVTRASLIAKTRYQPAMHELLDRNSDRGKLWFGDAEAVMVAKEKLDAATNDTDRAFYRNELITNLYKYRTTNPGAKDWDGSRATFPGRPEGAELGNVFYNNAIRTQQWLDGSENIAESTFEGKRIPAALKAVTSVAFLGGSMAQFAQNMISPITNVIPYLASKNGKTGFGGGFGAVAASLEYSRAFKDVVGVKGLKLFSTSTDANGKFSIRAGDPINDAQYYFDIAKKFEVARANKDTAKEAALQAEYNLTYYEARNIGREIREGKLIPAQANAVLETSRGLYSGGKLGRAWMKFVDTYMVPFNVSEQSARRATFLAAFRLEFNRLKQAGVDEDKASEMARAFGVQTVDLTLGEYSTTNRPPAWREGPASLLFMYKTYPITVALLMRNLSYGGKIGMLTGLMFLSGMSGLPFAEDIEDLMDTLAQKFGLDIGQGPALRKFLTEQLDAAFPGIAPFVIKGVANQFAPIDVAAKTGIGNIIPGTGFLLAGSDPSHELAEVAGPIFGMGFNMTKFTYDLIRAPVSETTTVVDALRNSPVSLARSVGDVAMYLQSGAIVDKRGYVVAPEVNAATVLTRLLGFYPVAAAEQYEFIKYARRAADYQRQVSVAYRDAWIKAMVSGDRQQAARIVQAVNEWNAANPDAKLNNWLKNSQRALKEAQRPAGERFLKSTPLASRGDLQRFQDAMIE